MLSTKQRDSDRAVLKMAKTERRFYTNWTPAALLRQFIEDEIECRADSDSYYAPNAAQAMKALGKLERELARLRGRPTMAAKRRRSSASGSCPIAGVSPPDWR